MKRIIFTIIAIITLSQVVSAENGYDLWLRYNRLGDKAVEKGYAKRVASITVKGDLTPTLTAAVDELTAAVAGLTGKRPVVSVSPVKGSVVLCRETELPEAMRRGLEPEGYRIFSGQLDGKRVTVIAGGDDLGALYGTFRLISLMQRGMSIDNVDIADAPSVKLRVLNHWDNLNGSIERGYAGYSLWNWERLPVDIDPRYIDYARANASIGINGTVVNNVNAQARSLRHTELVRLTGLADAFRPYGIRVYLTAKFSAPIEIGGLKTADPADPDVRKWWVEKVREIYSLIPDFGGFLVKANSEGQPGPQDYGRTHADGANMLGEALAPYGGVVFWRAFVYQNDRRNDRIMGGYKEFKPLDGQFLPNVMVQPKNGPLDFQPREPFHPLLGAMPATSLSLEFQITQENLGHAGHLVYLGRLYEETLQSEVDGRGTTVGDVIKGYGNTTGYSAIAGVPNIGSEINWTGHPFGQANWFAFGRLAWNPDASSEAIAAEWVERTFTRIPAAVDKIVDMMMLSREAVVNYSMPLGLNHIMNYGTHNGPEPWHDDPVWTAFDYHKVTADSIGVDRTPSGSNAVGQYDPSVASRFASLSTCPDEYLLWFHRLPWNYRMRSGRILWDELAYRYNLGVEQVRSMQNTWADVASEIDPQRHGRVARLLRFQEDEAKWWRDGCLLFFGQYSGMPLPAGYPAPEHSLDYYKRIPFPYDWKGRFE